MLFQKNMGCPSQKMSPLEVIHTDQWNLSFLFDNSLAACEQKWYDQTCRAAYNKMPKNVRGQLKLVSVHLSQWEQISDNISATRYPSEYYFE